MAPEDLAGLENYADQALTAFVYQGEDRGIQFTFRRAPHMAPWACRHWWGQPAWPDLVGRFLCALDGPGDSQWDLMDSSGRGCVQNRPWCKTVMSC